MTFPFKDGPFLKGQSLILGDGGGVHLLFQVDICQKKGN